MGREDVKYFRIKFPREKESIMPTKSGRRVARPAHEEDQDEPDVSTPSFARNYPSLYGFIAECRKNEKFHERGCLTVFYEDGVFKVSLNDRPNCQSSFVSHQELGTCFRIADSGLRSGTLKWRRNKRYAAQAQRLFK